MSEEAGTEGNFPRARLTMGHIAGVQVEFILPAATVAELVSRVDRLISALVDKGWSVVATGNSFEGADGVPLCPIHKKPMKPSQHGGWFCPVKIAADDGAGKPVFCKATV